jgi:hypothetical protein
MKHVEQELRSPRPSEELENRLGPSKYLEEKNYFLANSCHEQLTSRPEGEVARQKVKRMADLDSIPRMIYYGFKTISCCDSGIEALSTCLSKNAKSCSHSARASIAFRLVAI